MTSARTFDMRVASRVETTNVIFSSISKEEVAPISTFLQSKNVRLTNEMDEMLVDVDPIDDSEDDEEMSIDSDENTGRKKERVSKPSRDDDDESGKSLPFLTDKRQLIPAYRGRRLPRRGGIR